MPQIEDLQMSASRPLRSTCIKAAVWAMRGEINEWLRANDNDPIEDENDELFDVLITELQYGVSDGYLLARALEKANVLDPDAELVEILDAAELEVNRQHTMAMEKWVKATRKRPQYRIGDAISWNGETYTIARIFFETYKYALKRNETDTIYQIVNCEDVEVARRVRKAS